MGARSVEWRALVPDRVRYVGELVAAVVAEDRWTARAALDDVVVDYEELPAVADPYEALEPGAPLVEPEWGDNVILRRSFQSGDADAALAVAGRRAAGSLACGRLAGSPIEPRGCVSSYDPASGRLDHWDATQQPHVLRTFLAETLGMPEGSVRVFSPTSVGAFGLKQPLYQEQATLAEAQPAAGATREVDRGARREPHRRRPQPGHRCRVRGRLRGGGRISALRRASSPTSVHQPHCSAGRCRS